MQVSLPLGAPNMYRWTPSLNLLIRIDQDQYSLIRKDREFIFCSRGSNEVNYSSTKWKVGKYHYNKNKHYIFSPQQLPRYQLWQQRGEACLPAHQDTWHQLLISTAGLRCWNVSQEWHYATGFCQLNPEHLCLGETNGKMHLIVTSINKYIEMN